MKVRAIKSYFQIVLGFILELKLVTFSEYIRTLRNPMIETEKGLSREI